MACAAKSKRHSPKAVRITDGHGGNPLRRAERLKNRGVVIDVIGVGESPASVDERLLTRIASTVQGELRYCFIRDARSLVQRYTTIAQKTSVGA